jgi:large subunit ribosomal protein L3
MTAKRFPEGILGRKVGMTQVFTAEGEVVPVTVIEAGPCYVLDVRSTERNGYAAAQLGFKPKKMQRVTKPMAGHFAKAEKGAFYHVQEIRCDVPALGWNVGQEINAGDVFQAGELVDISGVSIGRGFSGVVRRYKVKGQPATRGTHEYRRHIGAIGCRKFPGRVFKGQRMPGRMGGADVTVQNLTVVAVKPENNLILIRGGIPGSKGAVVVIRKAMKKRKSEPTAKAA